MNYNGKRFRPISGSDNSETTQETIFEYHQTGQILSADYSGGNIVKGQLIGLVADNGTIEMRYQQINVNNELMTGECTSVPETMGNGKLRLHETWVWTSGDRSKGQSILEEI
ncbi:n-acetylglutamate synthase [Zobellia galactanivorans]|uniref:n-acetylglutamate synthase n=1 Tax=Zobellia galactanivorans (strain DSM 12802 / CCUG 47099 / CIP 106680 / NCIMB 13871 / Dsij) TaxID=63186 RepID=UPI001C06A1F4|nr:n-acetylglutamate synthase [Zobellia galactanivorans]MBU3025950.1 n-acetylglutamate synthase [Zobellia galactanivorans]